MRLLAELRATAVFTLTALTRAMARSTTASDSRSDCQLSPAIPGRYFLLLGDALSLVARVVRVGARAGFAPPPLGSVWVTRLNPTGLSRYSPRAARSK